MDMTSVTSAQRAVVITVKQAYADNDKTSASFQNFWQAFHTQCLRDSVTLPNQEDILWLLGLTDKTDVVIII